MPRQESRTNMAIWQDADWRTLPFPAQHLYKMLWEHPQLTYCGVADWRPGRIAAMGGGLTSDLVQTLGDCLEARHFIIRDTDTEEVLLRSWVRWDGLMKQPRLAVSYANAYAAVASNDLRAVMVHELLRLRDREPNLAGLSSPRVVEMFDLPALDPKVRATPVDPFAHGFGYRFGYGFTPGSDETSLSVSVPVSVPPTPSPAPSPTPKRESTARSVQLPDRWAPTTEDVAAIRAEFPHLDTRAEHVKFTDHFRANGKTMKNWSAAWRNWMRRSAEFAPNNVRTLDRGTTSSGNPLPAGAEAWMQPTRGDR